jgi:hypothetical protein
MCLLLGILSVVVLERKLRFFHCVCVLLLTRMCSLTYRDPQCRGFEAQTPPLSLAWHAPRVCWGPHCRQQVFSLSLSLSLSLSDLSLRSLSQISLSFSLSRARSLSL